MHTRWPDDKLKIQIYKTNEGNMWAGAVLRGDTTFHDIREPHICDWVRWLGKKTEVLADRTQEIDVDTLKELAKEDWERERACSYWAPSVYTYQRTMLARAKDMGFTDEEMVGDK